MVLRTRDPFSSEATMRVWNMICAAMAPLAAGLAGAAPAQASNYEFLAAPQINLSLVYRLDRLTGEVIA
jgi:hypothetical protein